MASFESINEQLRMAAERLDQAATEIRDLPLDLVKEHLRSIGEALASVFQIQHLIYRLRPDLQPAYLTEEVPDTDPDLTFEEKALVEKLSNEAIQEIDKQLLFHAQRNWRKVAMIVGITMMELNDCPEGISDVFMLNESGNLLKKGVLNPMEIWNTCSSVKCVFLVVMINTLFLGRVCDSFSIKLDYDDKIT